MRRGSREAGYNLVVLAVAVTILNVLLAASLPLWSRAIQREKEEELIARGLQYGEAIRVFRNRFGRLPIRLEELIEVEPRSIRRLWKDPMTESGEWDLIFEGQPTPPGGPNQPGQPPPPPGSGATPGAGEGADGRQLVAIGGLGGSGDGRVTVGPIAGVRSRSKEESIKVFFGKQTHAEWQFTYLLFQGAQAFGVPGSANPIALPTRAEWIGRPFPPDLLPQGVGAPAELPQGGNAFPQGQAPGGGRPGSRDSKPDDKP
jgi:type II secretory pathway pseudopilin PulG